jgi:hypothetical protein
MKSMLRPVQDRSRRASVSPSSSSSGDDAFTQDDSKCHADLIVVRVMESVTTDGHLKRAPFMFLALSQTFLRRLLCQKHRLAARHHVRPFRPVQ